ncbi:hypothetical protein N7520_000198 [Penicillium odoratum]|uniref:uncharacterized protein n=1 Tax=Penicillium odoratum TaxID=1167516 RepID=UPI0025496111|nr:uncharacterized protein N7520_000198 [Penicillium odoratum]KAJ5776952.1 hypothetical protein N7520_000198 [Penicillium odoratum]
MLSLGTEVAIAASGAAVFVVCSAIAIVVWVRVRKERLALRVLSLRHGRLTHSIGYTRDTLTELSREEDLALRAHGNLPYGKPNEWGLANSREQLLRPKNGSDSSFPLMEKARSLRHSLSRSRSKRLSRSSQRHSRMSSMATVAETVIHHTPPRTSQSREDIPLSAVEGILELPAEHTPRQTPDLTHEEPGFHLGMRPVSPSSAWPLPSQKDRSSQFPVLESRNSQEMFDPPPRIFEESPPRGRGVSVASQSPGMAPDKPIPPPPATVMPLDRLSYLRNDSIMRLSSMSLDTTNSSILEDSRQGPGSLDTNITSPNFPSGGTSVPFSANDVGVKNGRRSFIAANTSMPPLHNFPVRSSSTVEGRRRSSIDPIASPRRSMTTNSRNPSSSSENRFSFVPIPRRRDSIASNGPQRHASLRSGTPVSINSYQGGPTINWRHSNSSLSFVPYLGQFQQPAYWGGEYEADPFYGSSPRSNGTLFSIGSPGQTVGSMPPSPMQRSSLSLRGQPLPSALKGSNSQRKGHRRQNCVRISIHPPMTFGGPTFSPTVEEEPEDLDAMEELDLRESAINGNFKSLPTLPPPTASPSPLSKRSSRRSKSAHSTLGPLAEEPTASSNKSTPNKKQDVTPSNDLFGKDRDLHERFTYLPPDEDEGVLTHTPSPEHKLNFWAIPEEGPSHSYENHFNGSPRRTPLKGPRSQPGRNARSNSTPKPMDPLPLMGIGPSTGLPLITGTQGSDWRKSTDSLYRTNTDSSPRRNRDSNGSQSLGLIGPSILPNTSRARSGTVKDRVTIWEDANRSGSPPKPTAAHMAGYVFSDTSTSPTRLHNSIPRSLSKSGHSPIRMASHSSARRGLTTPTRKALGLGIGTPGSLYDGDGFLKE